MTGAERNHLENMAVDIKTGHDIERWKRQNRSRALEVCQGIVELEDDFETVFEFALDGDLFEEFRITRKECRR